MEEAKAIKLSENAIEELQQIPYEGKPAPLKTVNMTLQIHAIKKTVTNRTPNVTYAATLADMKRKYSGFIIIPRDNENELNNGDIITIKIVSIALINNDKMKAFIVKSYELLAINHSFLSNPEQIKAQSTGQSTNENENNKDNNSLEEDINRPPEQSTNDIQFEDQIQHNNNHINDQSVSNVNSLLEKTMLLSQITTFTKDITLYVKVMKKWEMRNYVNKQTKQPGRLLSFTIADVEGFEMQVTCFGLVCDRLNNIIKENGLYLIRGGYAKLSEKKYTNIKSDYKLIFDDKTKIEEMENDGSFKDTISNVTQLKDLHSCQVKTNIDCVVYVIEAFKTTIKATRAGEMSIRKLILGDISGFKCDFTLWRKFAELVINQGDILYMKNVRVGDFNGRSLGTVDNSIIIANPDMPERKVLESYLTAGLSWVPIPNNNAQTDANQALNPINAIYLKDLFDSISESNDSPLSKIKGTICTLTHTEKNFYPGCSFLPCKKKVIPEANGWTCLNCNKTIEKPLYYYTISIRVKDASGEHWIDLYGETATKLFGMECDEYKDYIQNKDDIKLQQLTNQIEFQTYFFIGKAKVNMYNNNPKKKFQVYRFEAVSKAQEAKRQIKEIKAHLSL